MHRRRVATLVAAALTGILAVQGCADPDAAPVATPVEHPCGPGVDPATARVVDVYVAMLGHLVRQRGHGVAGTEVLYLVDHAVPEFQETGIPEHEKRTPAPASRSTAEFPAPLRRCLEGARFDGLPPIRLVEDWDDPAIPTEPVPAKGFPPGKEPRRYTGGRLFFLGGVPATGERLALAASSSGGRGFDFSGGLFVLREQGGSWRVVSQDRYWIA
jgi:hypothetical protein